jgi:hypothetical protein
MQKGLNLKAAGKGRKKESGTDCFRGCAKGPRYLLSATECAAGLDVSAQLQKRSSSFLCPPPPGGGLIFSLSLCPVVIPIRFLDVQWSFGTDQGKRLVSVFLFGREQNSSKVIAAKKKREKRTKLESSRMSVTLASAAVAVLSGGGGGAESPDTMRCGRETRNGRHDKLVARECDRNLGRNTLIRTESGPSFISI